MRHHAGAVLSFLTTELSNMFPNQERIAGVTCPTLIGILMLLVFARFLLTSFRKDSSRGSGPCDILRAGAKAARCLQGERPNHTLV